jgi:tetratricopeptide (TPR) repeat protein
MPVTYGLGRWDDFHRFSEEFLSRLGPQHYQAGLLYEIRGRIRLARGDLAGALEDAGAALENARRTKDPQRAQPALAYAAFVQLSAGRLQECADRIDELLALDPVEVGVSHPINPVLDLAWILTALGRADEFLAAAARAATSTRWLEAGTAYARGHVEKAADICAVIGVLPNEAYMRLRAGERMLDDGRPEAAEPQLRKALEFYRSVHADAYIRAAEALRRTYQALDAASGTDDR